MNKVFDPSPNYTAASRCQAEYGQPRTFKEIAIHWWDAPEKKPTLQGTVNTLKDPKRRASAHYVVSDKSIIQLVDEENVSWATGSANPFTISIEIDPNTPGDTYKTVGQLVADIRKRRGIMPLVPHNKYMNTQCPGTISFQRIEENTLDETKKRLDNAIYNSGEYDKVCAMLGLPKQDNYGKNAPYEVVKEKFDEKDQKIRDREKDITKLTEQITKEKERYTDLLNRFEKDEEEDNEAIRVGIEAQHERDSLRSDLEAITVILGVSKESSREDILDAIAELQKPHDKVADEAVEAYLYKRAEKLFTSFIDWLKYGLQVWRNKKS